MRGFIPKQGGPVHRRYGIHPPARPFPSLQARGRSLVLLVLLVMPCPLSAQEIRGPVFTVDPPFVLFDTTHCGTTKCRTVTIRNDGDTLLTVHSMGEFSHPFSGGLPTPLHLNPGESRVMNLCYSPSSGSSLDTLWSDYIADQRRALSIALLLDVSASMLNADIGDTARMRSVSRLETARSISLETIGGLAHTGSMRDEAAIVRFAGLDDFALRHPFATDTSGMWIALPDTATGQSTCLYDALVRSAPILGERNKARAMLLITDGRNICTDSHTPADVIAALQREGITLFAVGLGNADSSSLATIATACGGFYFPVHSFEQKTALFKKIVTVMSRAGTGRMRLEGSGVAPDVRFSVPSIDFGTVNVGERPCMTCALSNKGNAAFNGSIGTSHPVLEIDSPASGEIKELLPGDSTTMRFCFKANTIGTKEGLLECAFEPPFCDDGHRSIPWSGVSRDYIGLAIPPFLRSRPGSSFTVPVNLRGRIPEEYGLTELSFSLRYNKTMIHPDPAGAIRRDASMTRSLPDASCSTEYQERDAITTYRFSGGTIASEEPNALLSTLSFITLLGNALETVIEPLHLRFSTPYLEAAAFPTALFLSDSVCYGEEALIQAGVLRDVVLEQSSPNPASRSGGSGGMIEIRYSLAREGHARLSLHDVYGREVARPVDDFRTAGKHLEVFLASKLEPGIYVYMLQTPYARVARKMIVTE